MCTIDGCTGRAVAKGLCAKHYMRARRTGDPANTRKPGGKKDEVLALCDQLCRDLSARNRARYSAAMRFLDPERIEALKASGGFMSYAKLLDLAKAIDYLRRLQCIRPDLAEKVIAGEMSAHAAAIAVRRRERR
jgi:hypothetical protein